MARIETFTFRINKNERRMLRSLASHLQRSQSDAVRLLIREAVKDLGEDPGLHTNEVKREAQHANTR